MTADRELQASADRMAALANSALALMADSIATAQGVAALVAADMLELAALVPAADAAAECAGGRRCRACAAAPGAGAT